ncbi:MAG: hypothetical protein LAO31_02610 [Acidobacteriia bacterium]|nr:hypothetical protein [Terriglobia bacterium]
MRRISALFFAILFCSAAVLFAQTARTQNDKPTPTAPKEQAGNSTKTASAGGDFQDAGKQITTEYGKGGKAMGHGGKELGEETAHGEPVKGTAGFGKGVGSFGKHVGVGTGMAAKDVAKGTSRGARGVASAFGKLF